MSILRSAPLAIATLVAPLAAQIPPQPFVPPPTNLQVFHNSGQTFLTWTEVGSLAGESYRIYRRDAAVGPITSTVGMTPVFEVWEDSAVMYADRIQVNGAPGTPRYVARAVIVDDQPELAAGTGLLVLTLRANDFPAGTSGAAHYAVTTVDAAGNENTAVTTGPAGNGTGAASAVAEAVADPSPVRVGPPSTAPSRVFIQYLDCRKVNTTFLGPNALNGWWGEPQAAPHIRNAHTYACTYRVAEPASPVPGPLPVVVELHVHAGNRMPARTSASPWDAVLIEPIDVNDTWWFGFARSHDYRQGLDPQTGKIANVTEARVLRMVHDLLRDTRYQTDPERVYVYGHSMGGSGALALSMRYPDVFAAAFASKPMTDYAAYVNGPVGDYRDSLSDMWGSPMLVSLATQFDAPNGWAAHLQPYAGVQNRIWKWQNHQLQMGNLWREEMVPIGIVQGLNDTILPGDTQADPFADDLVAAGRACSLLVNCSGHNSVMFQGMPRALEPVSNGSIDVPFHNFQVVRSETVPGFANVVALAGPAPCLPPSSCVDCTTVNAARYLRDLEWAATWVVAANPWAAAPVDTPTRWEMSLRTPPGSGKVFAVDVTLRRLQGFQPQPNTTYTWWNLQGTNLSPANTATADADGVLTIPGFTVTEFGNRLIVM